MKRRERRIADLDVSGSSDSSAKKQRSHGQRTDRDQRHWPGIVPDFQSWYILQENSLHDYHHVSKGIDVGERLKPGRHILDRAGIPRH